MACEHPFDELRARKAWWVCDVCNEPVEPIGEIGARRYIEERHGPFESTVDQTIRIMGPPACGPHRIVRGPKPPPRPPSKPRPHSLWHRPCKER